MLAEMRPSELGVWLAIWNREPWDEARADLRSAIVAMQVSTAGLKPPSRKGRWQLDDFMPYAEKPPALSEIDELRKRFGDRVKRKGNG
jgi:hypothetical protein